MNDYIKTKTEGFAVDRKTGLVININDSEEMNMRKERQYRKDIANLKRDVEYLKEELIKIKNNIGIA
jgi:hypothetical protein